MIDNDHLLKHARFAAAQVCADSERPEHRTLLGAAETLFNELLLREDPGFYVEHIARGKALLAEGRQLATALHKPLPAAPQLRGDINGDLRSRVLEGEIDKLNAGMLDVIAVLDENASGQEKAWLVAACNWETNLYLHRAQRVAAPGPATAKPIDAASVLAYLQRRFPAWTSLRITSFVPLSGGFSKKTILVDTADESNGHQSIVFRVDQGINLFQFDGSDIAKEFHLIQLVRKHGVPVAEPLWLEDDASQLGHRFMVSRRALGKTYGNHFGSDGELGQDSVGPIVDSLIAGLVALHRVPIDARDTDVQQSHLSDWLPYKTVTEATRYCVTEYLPKLIRLTDVPLTPQLQRTLNWLARNVPEVDEPAVITHLDYGFNNIIFDDTKISAVLDWETSHPGDPAADIAWTHHQNLAPYLSMDELLRRYKAGTGRDISAYRLAYWRVVNCLGGAMACLSSLRALETHESPPVNIAVMAFQYVAAFGPQFNMLIDAAEAARGR